METIALILVLVAVSISFRGTPQGMRMNLPLDKIIRLIDNGASTP